MWKNIVQPESPLTIWRLRIACWIPKATNTLSEYVILIDFPLQHPTNAPCFYVIRTVPVLLANCFAISAVALWRTNQFRRFLGTRISVKVNTKHVPMVSKSIRYDVLHIVKVQLAGWTGDVMDKITVFNTAVVWDTTHMIQHIRTDVSEKSVAWDLRLP
jgi:hypothetical protein